MSHLFEVYSHIPCLLDTCIYYLQLMITLVMFIIAATVLLYKNVWTMVANFKWYKWVLV